MEMEVGKRLQNELVTVVDDFRIHVRRHFFFNGEDPPRVIEQQCATLINRQFPKGRSSHDGTFQNFHIILSFRAEGKKKRVQSDPRRTEHP